MQRAPNPSHTCNAPAGVLHERDCDPGDALEATVQRLRSGLNVTLHGGAHPRGSAGRQGHCNQRADAFPGVTVFGGHSLGTCPWCRVETFPLAARTSSQAQRRKHAHGCPPGIARTPSG
eukprot:22707-Chlamydomonas_euryale.AAC.17